MIARIAKPLAAMGCRTSTRGDWIFHAVVICILVAMSFCGAR